MVCSAVAEERDTLPPTNTMAMGPERSKPLHNFTLPLLKWGNQRHLRCMKLSPDGGCDVSNSGIRRSPVTEAQNLMVTRKRELESDKQRGMAKDSGKRMRISKSGVATDEEEGIEAVREKLMFDLKTAADKMKDAILRKEAAEENEDEEENHLPPAISAPTSVSEVRPWNLRTRRSACKAPLSGSNGKAFKIEERKPNLSPLRSEGGTKSPRSRGTPDRVGRVKFSVSLSRKEIESDFMAMLSHRPPRRPKKRAKTVQKQLDSLFPGLWLSEINSELYKVPESAENGRL